MSEHKGAIMPSPIYTSVNEGATWFLFFKNFLLRILFCMTGSSIEAHNNIRKGLWEGHFVRKEINMSLPFLDSKLKFMI